MAARFLQCGDSAITVSFGQEVTLVLNERVRAFCLEAQRLRPAAVSEIVPALASATLHFNPLHPAARDLLRTVQTIESRSAERAPESGRRHHIPVHYGGGDGPDLEELAALHGLRSDDVVRLHSGRELVVYCLGFSPGFPYLGPLPAELETPRLETPRKRVPAGSVGIGGRQTGIYPVASPGGWRLIGRTNISLFDLERDPPALLQPGDRVMFQPVDALPPEEASGAAVQTPDSTGNCILEIVRPGLLSTIQDLGRHGYQAQGVSVCGAMDELSARLANQLVGNPASAAVIEATLVGPTLRALGPALVAVTGADLERRLNGREAPASALMELSAGDELELGQVRRGARAYIAVAGGFDLPLILGSRCTDIRAGFGGFGGRPLKAGDRLAVCPGVGAPSSGWRPPPLPGRETTVRVMLGPQHDHFPAEALARLQQDAFLVSDDADRMGFRLHGPRLRHTGPVEIISDGVVLGSIQVPPDGQPIVMMADRQSLGGYPKIATVISADIHLLAQCRPGSLVRFQAVDLDEAWQALKDQSLLMQGAGGRPIPEAPLARLLADMAASDTDEIRLRAGPIHLHVRRQMHSKR